jgi:hypothetical protein
MSIVPPFDQPEQVCKPLLLGKRETRHAGINRTARLITSGRNLIGQYLTDFSAKDIYGCAAGSVEEQTTRLMPIFEVLAAPLFQGGTNRADWDDDLVSPCETGSDKGALNFSSSFQISAFSFKRHDPVGSIGETGHQKVPFSYFSQDLFEQVHDPGWADPFVGDAFMA